MNRTVINKDALSKIQNIHELSRKYNERLGHNHASRLLSLMQEHINEIQELHSKGSSHCMTETGDLIMLCFELLIEKSASINEVMNQCFKRYDTKLSKLLQEINR